MADPTTKDDRVEVVGPWSETENTEERTTVRRTSAFEDAARRKMSVTEMTENVTGELVLL
jgi:hypothetical protein